MFSDLDRLMRERSIDAVVVPMHEANHASFRWLSRGAKVTRGYLVKLAGSDPILVTYPMERDEALASGWKVLLADEFDATRIFRESEGEGEAYAEFFSTMLRRLGSGPSLALFGNVPVHLYLGIARGLEQRGWILANRAGEDLIQLARKRKEPWEIDAIRSVGERTEIVVDAVRALLRTDGTRGTLTLGDLKRLVTSEISRLGMVEDHETILSQGRDAGVPHSRGDAAAPLRLSLPVVLDIFPMDRVSGYFFDFTRTFCIGPVPDELRQIHHDVLEAFTLARTTLRPGMTAASLQDLVCAFFESKGYPTSRSRPGTLEGYIHGLGHGVGLDIHERPSFSLNPANTDRIEEGDVLTIEPGLYFPDRQIGVRIEDTFVVTASGAETLCRSEYGLSP